MGFRDLLAIVTSEAGGRSVLACARQLAQQNSARLSTLVVNWLPALPMVVEGHAVDPYWADLVRRAEEDLKTEGVKVKAALERDADNPAIESLLLELGSARPVLGMRARHADITIAARPKKAAAESEFAVLEGALFQSGRPVMLVPPDWKQRAIGRSVLVSWKATREAARALADASEFLHGAARVTVVTVDAKPSEGGYGAQPGADISTHLARHGLKPELMNLDSTGRSDAQTILDQAIAVDADLIVMGGYGRSRMSEFIFGGVTRGMLASSPIPILMAH